MLAQAHTFTSERYRSFPHDRGTFAQSQRRSAQPGHQHWYDLGSITNNRQGQSHAYRSSTATLNIIRHGQAIDLRVDEVAVVSMATGWTQTDVGGGVALWSTHDSVTNQLSAIGGLSSGDSRHLVNLLGEAVAW